MRGERCEVAAFESAKTKVYSLQREAVLLVEMPSKFTGVRRIGQRSRRDEAVGSVVFEKVAHDDEPTVHSIGQRGELLPVGVECAEDVGPGLILIE